MADRIVGEYDIKVNDAIKQLDKLAGRVSNLEKQSKKSAQGTEDAYSKMATNLTAQFKNVAGALGIAFGAQQVIALGKEMVTLAAQAEGVERAFKRVGSPQLLADLRKATRGTVSDIKLMTTAIQSANFQIPLENLAKYMQFAQQRARETGKTVDYLIDSILTGVGRGSIEVWDNMGFSLTKVRENLNGVSIESLSVADRAKLMSDLVNEELAKMGDQADTTADRIGQITTALENMKVKGGAAINDVINDLIKLAEKKGLVESNLSFREQIQSTIEYAAAVRNATAQIQNDRFQEQRLLEEVDDKEALLQLNREERTAKLKRLEEEYLQISSKENKDAQDLKLWFAKQELENAVGLDVYKRSAAKARINEINQEIKQSVIREGALKAQIDLLSDILGLTEKLGGKGGISKEQIHNVFYYTNLIKNLEEEQEKEATTVERVLELNEELKIAREKLAKLLGKETKAQKEYNEALKEMPIKEANVRFGDYILKGEDGQVVFRYLGDTIDGLNTLLKEQEDILKEAPEFSEKYNRASDAIDRLKKKLEEFSDSQIDPTEGFNISATAAGLLPETTTLEQKLSEQLALFNEFADAVGQLFSSIQANISASYAREQEDLQSQLEQGLISREQYEAELANIKRREAAANKDAAIFQATISTAQAVVNALGSFPFSPQNIALAAAIGAAGAAQIAAIASQPLPQFAEGGFVNEHGEIKGRKHKHGGVLIEAEGGEFITSAKYARQNSAILKAINTGDWERYKVENIIAPAIEQAMSGGFEGMGASYQIQQMFNDKNILKAEDRHRQSNKEGFMYLGKKIDSLNRRASRWN